MYNTIMMHNVESHMDQILFVVSPGAIHAFNGDYSRGLSMPGTGLNPPLSVNAVECMLRYQVVQSPFSPNI